MKATRWVAFVGAAMVGGAAACWAEGDPKPAPGGTVHTVAIVLRAVGGQCLVTAPKDKPRVSAKKDVIEWTFDNGCDKEMDLGVGNFKHTPPSAAQKDEKSDPDPLHPDDKRHIKVGAKASNKLVSRIRPDAIPWRTYKYDILDGTRPLLDPEVEIRP